MTFDLRPRHPLALCGLLLALGATPAFALQFRVLGWDADDHSLRFDQGETSTELQIEPGRLSPVYEAPDAASLALYRVLSGPAGEPRREIACAVAAPPGLHRGILILLPASPPASWLKLRRGDHVVVVPRVYEPLWLDDSPEARPAGTIEFRNLQSLPLALRVGDRDIQLPPRGEARAPLDPDTRRVALKAAVLLDGRWRMFASSPLPTHDTGRLLVIFRRVAAGTPVDPDDPGIRMIRLHEPPVPVPPTPPVP